MIPRIVVYGASGRVGRRLAAALIAAGEPVTLAGRDEQKLRTLAGDLGGQVDAVACALTDEAALDRLVTGRRVVVNCASPAFRTGEPLIRAALRAGVHYADSAGEQPFIHAVFERHDATAIDRNVALVPALGFDYAIGDCLAAIAARGHEPATEIRLAYGIVGAGVGASSVHHVADTPHSGEVIYRNGRWRPAPLGVQQWRYGFPDPIGPQRMTRYGSGEIVTVPRHTRTASVTSWITVRSLSPHPALDPVFPYLRPLVSVALRTPLRHIVGLATKSVQVPKEFHDDQAQQASQFVVAAIANGPDGDVGHAVASGSDFHRVTAATLAYGARELARDGFDRRGALGPAAAVGPEALLDALAAAGVTWQRLS